LLVAASGVADLVALLEAGAGEVGDDEVGYDEAAPAAADVLDVVLVTRPGADPAMLMAARSALDEDVRAHVVGAELGWYEGWADDLGGELPLALPLAVELPRGGDADRALAEVRAAHRAGLDVVLKFRTGPTPTWPWPDEDELANVLRLAAGEVPFKLTGGLHHAVRGGYDVAGVPEENHGVLNVLVATSAALSGAGHEEVAGLLALRDAAALAELVGSWTDDTAIRVRDAFTGYGCCTVTDPLGELADLGVADLGVTGVGPQAPLP
jgi:hypothetical protein